MARAEINEVVLDDSGRPVNGATVEVRLRGTSTKATVFAAETGSSAVANPQTVSLGRIDGWLDQGSYDLVVTRRGVTVTQPFEAVSGAEVAAVTTGGATDAEVAAAVAALASTVATDAELAAAVTTLNTALSGKQSVSEKGQANGYAALDGTGKVPEAQLPASGLDAHLADTTEAHDASAISVVPFASIAATNVQDALAEIVAEQPVGGGSGSAERLGSTEFRPYRQWYTSFENAEADAAEWIFFNHAKTTDAGVPSVQPVGNRMVGVFLKDQRLRNLDIRMQYRTPAPNNFHGVHVFARCQAPLKSSRQTISVTGSPTGGTFTLTLNGSTTAPIAYNATATAIQSALEALPTVGTGNVIVTGGPMPGAVIAQFLGELESIPLPALTGSAASLTGGTTPAVTVATDLSPQQDISASQAIKVSKGFNPNSPNFAGSQTADIDVLSTAVRNMRVQVIEGIFRAKSWIDATQNSTQTVTIGGAPTGGTFTLSFRGQTTAPIAYNATAAQVDTALEALSTIGSGNVSVSGSNGGPYTVVFIGTLSNTQVPTLTASAAGLTGGTSPTVTTAQTQYGASGREPDWQVTRSIDAGSGGGVDFPDMGAIGVGIYTANTATPSIRSVRITELVRASENLILNSSLETIDQARTGTSDGSNPPAYWNPFVQGTGVSNTVLIADRFGVTRRALHMTRSTGTDLGNWGQEIHAAGFGGPSAYGNRRRKPYYTLTEFPDALEVSLWSKGSNIVNPGGLAAAAVLYYYSEGAEALNNNPSVDLYYAGLGPNSAPGQDSGEGTWDWFQTVFRITMLFARRITFARLDVGLHDVTTTGELWVQDVRVRPVP